MTADGDASGTTKRDVIMDEIRRLILTGGLERGSRLPQDELAARFRCSITPVREALRALESEGLVVSAPHRGTRVAAFDLDRIKAIYIVRRLTESYAMSRAATRLTIRDLHRVTQLMEEFDTASAAGEELQARQANRDFHFYFYDRTGVPALAEQIGTLWDSFPWDLILGSPDRAADSGREHREIVEAVRAGDPDAAANAASEHIRRGYRALAHHVLGSDDTDPFDLDVD